MNSTAIQQLVVDTATSLGIPPTLALAVANQESGYNPNIVSKAGASGVMQLMPATAKSLGVSDVFDPVQNVTGGLTYLQSLYNQFGDWSLALAAYNAGPGAVTKYGGIPPYKETQNYVTSIMTKAGDVSQVASANVSDTSAPVEYVSSDIGSTMGIAIVCGVVAVLWKVLRG